MPETIYINPFARQCRGADPSLSVIIPTYQRSSSLVAVLASLAGQADVAPREYEILVADDGSKDGTAQAVREWAEQARARVALAYGGRNRGPAHARNRAISMAASPILLITGDDILPGPDFLFRHRQWHQSHPDERDAVLGRVTWPESPRPTPFMRWLEHGGRAFYFAFPHQAGPVPPDRFYTCNVSVKRALLTRCGGFDESFPFASHEDIEMGLRLAMHGGMRLHYEPSIAGVHDHALTVEAALRRIYLSGYSSVLFWEKTPCPSSMAKRVCRSLCRRAAACCPVRLFRLRERSRMPVLWKLGLSLAYWRGAADAAAGRPVHVP